MVITTNNKIRNSLGSFKDREKIILLRIQKLYKAKLGRELKEHEVKEIADNLLNFARAIYGI